ncbi:uncharacterized protein LOC128239798 isoform X2 [Mya arenaria]|uniref:uncharacterized protein LOC128239798 isoform X2 n=1 Tax=Mya arenaria TaxID=6604 RepID=UPI0022E1EF1F|nr:uncharacterized protein LOC128239798 isoform X2 [Mya arenaria]
MCNMAKYVIGCLFCASLSLILGAPVSKENFDEIKAALKSKLQSQEQALESLSSAGTGTPQGVEYSNSKSYSYTNVNGVQHQDTQAEEKVSDPQNQHIISDLKEQLTEHQSADDSKPQTSFKAALDIPDEGIHKVITDGKVSDDSQPGQEYNEAKDALDFTPRVVAEYLYKTGETEEFQNLLNDLVQASEISADEAEQYEMAVMDELYKLEQEQSTMDVAPSYNSFYPPGYGMDREQPMVPVYGGMQGPRDIYPLYGFGQSGPATATEDENNYINFLMNKPVTLDEMINSLMNQWLTRAIETDPEAEEILNNIVDFVSQDDNPNDEAQVKAILGDIFAEALLEDLTPRIEPQDINLGSEPVSAPIVEEAGVGDKAEEQTDGANDITPVSGDQRVDEQVHQDNTEILDESQKMKM